MERHIQTGLGAIIIALIFWFGYTVTNTAKDVGVIAERIVNIQAQIQEMKVMFTDQNDALKRDMEATKAILSNHEARIIVLENKR